MFQKEHCCFQKNIVATKSCLLPILVWVSHRLFWKRPINISSVCKNVRLGSLPHPQFRKAHTIPSCSFRGRSNPLECGTSLEHKFCRKTSGKTLETSAAKALFQRPNTWGTRCDAPPLPWIQKKYHISTPAWSVSTHFIDLKFKWTKSRFSWRLQNLSCPAAFHALLAEECHSPSAANIFQPTGLAKIRTRGGQKRTVP